MGPNETEQKLLNKIRSLPPYKAAEVEDFIGTRENGRQLARATLRIPQRSYFFNELLVCPLEAESPTGSLFREVRGGC
jgi:hypothetical protein